MKFHFYQLQKPFSRHLAIDVGCGTGISTKLMAKYFDRIIGVDVSEAQISEAINNNQYDNVEFTYVKK